MLQEMSAKEAMKQYTEGKEVLVMYAATLKEGHPEYNVELLENMLSRMRFLVERTDKEKASGGGQSASAENNQENRRYAGGKDASAGRKPEQDSKAFRCFGISSELMGEILLCQKEQPKMSDV